MSDSRDELAAMAMMALVIKYGYKWGDDEEEQRMKGAETAYKIADAMIKYKGEEGRRRKDAVTAHHRKEHGNGR